MNLDGVKKAIIIIIGIAVVTALIFSFIFKLTFLETITYAQAIFSALALAFIIYTLYVSLIQLKKSMAKPLIKVAFNKDGEQQATLIYKDGQFKTGLPHPWLINKGNAVARYFQIDFIIPENIGKPSAYVPLSKDDGNYILSYISEGRYTLFVNRPYSDPNMLFSSAFNPSKCIELNEPSFKIKYKVYGDWAETQEGDLKVNINKQ
jgi:hypothetical protein